MQELAGQWYAILSTAYRTVGAPLALAVRTHEASLWTAVLLGVLGALSPCQLSTNVGALAYLSQGLARGRTIARALAYVAGKITVYTGLGVAAWGVGQGLNLATIPVAVIVRKALGPLMIIGALMLVGWLRPRFPIGERAARFFERLGERGGIAGAYLLGVAFSFAFCPTLMLLFFGILVPLALRSSAGVLFPGVFAVGTTLPLMAFLGLLVFGSDLAQGFVNRAAAVDRRLRLAAGVVLLAAGLNDTFLYWLL